jgi:hypothetical protein
MFGVTSVILTLAMEYLFVLRGEGQIVGYGSPVLSHQFGSVLTGVKCDTDAEVPTQCLAGLVLLSLDWIQLGVR